MALPTHFPSQVLAHYLANNGFGKLNEDTTKVAADWWIGWKSLPDKGDQFIAVMDTDSKIDFREHKAGEYAEFYGIQILLRSKTDEEVETKGKAIVDHLDSVVVPCRQIVLDGHGYRLSNFSRRGKFQFVKEEERNKRRVYSLNGFVTLWEV
jgi:hypothetical protein